MFTICLRDDKIDIISDEDNNKCSIYYYYSRCVTVVNIGNNYQSYIHNTCPNREEY